jgi:hypothetical protein
MNRCLSSMADMLKLAKLEETKGNVVIWNSDKSSFEVFNHGHTIGISHIYRQSKIQFIERDKPVCLVCHK